MQNLEYHTDVVDVGIFVTKTGFNLHPYGVFVR